MSATLAAVLNGETPAGLFQWQGDGHVDVAAHARAAGWAVRLIDTRAVGDAAQLYDRVATDWDLPEWFGRNLDALWDVLGDLAVAPLFVVWDGFTEMSAIDPQLTQNVLELLRDASTQAGALGVVVLDPPALIGLDALL